MLKLFLLNHAPLKVKLNEYYTPLTTKQPIWTGYTGYRYKVKSCSEGSITSSARSKLNETKFSRLHLLRNPGDSMELNNNYREEGGGGGGAGAGGT